MRDAIIATLPELEEISDEELRDKVISVWEEALTTKKLGHKHSETNAVYFACGRC